MNEEIKAKFSHQEISEIKIVDSDNVVITQKQIIQISVDEIKTREFIQESPYKGLNKFELGDKDLFFGREKLLGDLVKDLENNSLLLLLGASGSGKSSLVRAGILPWFARKYGSRSILTFTPQENPFKSLYASLVTKEYPSHEVEFIEDEKKDTFSEVIKKLKNKETNWLIFIDQFEQIFTRTSEEKCKNFLDSLVRWIQQNDQSVKLIMTMRADFLDRFASYPKFSKLIDNHKPFIADMDDHELRLVIEQPAAQHGVVFEKGLVEEIIKDVQGQKGYLPLLQYALDILWKDEQSSGELNDRTLNTKMYRNLGGVQGTLRKRVEEIYQDFTKRGLDKIVKQIFLKLVDFDKMDESGVMGKPVSRKAYRSEFSTDEQINKIIDQLIDPHRLLVGDGKEKTIELAHESLLTNWNTLKGWIEEHYQVIYWRNRLIDKRKRWETQKSDEDILRGSELTKILELRESNAFAVLGVKELTPQDDQFINLSRKKRDEKQKRQLIDIGAFAAMMTVAAAFSSWQWLNAEKSKIDSLVQTSKTELNSQNYFDSLLVSLKIGGNLKNPVRQLFLRNSDEDLRAKITFLKALYYIQVYNRFQNSEIGGVTDVKFNPKTNLLAVASEDGKIQSWNIETGKSQVFIGGRCRGCSLFSSPDGKILAATYMTRRRTDLNLLNWESLKQIDYIPDFIDIFFNSNNQQITTLSYIEDSTGSGSEGSEVCWWEIDEQKVSEKPPCEKVPEGFKIVDAENNLFVSSTESGIDEFWEFNLNRKPSRKPIPDNINFSKYICYLQKSSKIIGLDAGNSIIVLDLQLKNKYSFGNYQGLSSDIDGSIGCLENSIYIVDDQNNNNVELYLIKNTDAFPQLLRGYEQWNHGISIHPNRKILVSGSSDGKILLWRLDKTFNTLNTPQMSDNAQVIDLKSDYLIYKENENEKVKIFNLKERNSIPISDKVPAEVLNQDIFGLNINYPYLINQIDNKIRVVNLKNGESEELESKKHNCNFAGYYNKSAILNDRIMALSFDNIIYLWNMKTEKCTKPLELKQEEPFLLGDMPYDQSISSLEFNSQGNLLAAGSGHFIHVWNIRKEEPTIYTLEGHRERVLDVSFSPNSNLLASSSDDQTIKFWNVKTEKGYLIETLTLDQNIEHITFNSDGTSLMVLTDENNILEFDLTWDKLLEQGCDWMKDYIKTHPQEKELKQICRPFNSSS